MIDFGAYVNADDVARKLRLNNLALSEFGLSNLAIDGLIRSTTDAGLFSYLIQEKDLRDSIMFDGNIVRLTEPRWAEPIAQILANWIRAELLQARKKFSFETVFSHPSKVDFIKACSDLGYKVYLYFVGTSTPEINKFRVRYRVNQGGHSVPENKIEERYYRSMELLWEATHRCYQAYFFDNSRDGVRPTLFASYKVIDGLKRWDRLADDDIPEWFIKYYLRKANAHS